VTGNSLEEKVSYGLFLAAEADESVTCLSWQSVDGKGYFTADIKLRLSTGQRMEPDLILLATGVLWLIEVKGRHFEALDDEAKLVRLVEDLGPQRIRDTVKLRTGTDLDSVVVRVAVAFDVDDLATPDGRCLDSVAHLEWPRIEQALLEQSLSWILAAL